jgi:tetratricopeptide (TPR) repeat protein
VKRIFISLLAGALCTAGHGPASADISNDCYQTTLEQPGSPDRIIAVCTQAVGATVGEKRGQNLVSRGVGFMRKQKYNEALGDFDESLRAMPNDSWALSNRANVYRLMRDYDRALSDLNQLLRRDPKFIGAYVDRGMVHRDRGDVRSARADFEAVLGMSGGNIEIEKWAKRTAREELDKLPK